ncbi:MAG: hypothetical protein AB1673_12940 [Actinomycetota bacterium]
MSIPAFDHASPAIASLPVRAWPDPVIDALGHDPRSPYVEKFWLGILGPSTTWLLRLLAAEIEAHPEGFELDLAETAQCLGLSSRGGRHSAFMRALARCCRFDLADSRPDGTLAVRRRVPPLNRRQVLALPPSLADAHRAWQEADLAVPAAEQLRRRCRQLALSLIELGEDRDAVERQLVRWKYNPMVAREATLWATDRSATGLPQPWAATADHGPGPRNGSLAGPRPGAA